MTPALPYPSQSDTAQQQSAPEETDWSESEPGEPRTPYRRHQRHTDPLGHFDDTASQLRWDGTHADPDSFSTYQEARFATGQTIPYRRGHLEDFADPSRQSIPPKRNPPPPFPNPNPQGFNQQPQNPAMSYPGVPPPRPPSSAYPMYAPPMQPHAPGPYSAGWKNSMGGPRPMAPPQFTYPLPNDPLYVTHPGPIPPPPYAAVPRSHAYTGPHPQAAFPSRRKDHYTQYPAPQVPFEDYYAEASVPKPKKQPKLRQEKPPKRTTEPPFNQSYRDGLEEVKMELRNLAFTQQDEAERRRARIKKKTADAEKAHQAKEMKRLRKDIQNISLHLRDLDSRSEPVRRMLRSDISSRGFSTPAPSVVSSRTPGGIIMDSDPLVQQVAEFIEERHRRGLYPSYKGSNMSSPAELRSEMRSVVIDTLRELRGQSHSDLGDLHTTERPSHRRAASEVPFSGGGHRPLSQDWDTAATASSSNPFIPNQPIFARANHQGFSPHQRQDEAYWTGTVPHHSKKTRKRRDSQVQQDMNAPLRGGLSPGDSGYASPEPLRPRSRLRKRTVSFQDAEGTSRPTCDDLGNAEEDDWSDDEAGASDHLRPRAQRYATTVPHRSLNITVNPPVPLPDQYLAERGLGLR